MSWHCPMCGETTEKLKWCKIMVAPISGGIPFTFVCHIRCLRNVVSRFDYTLDKGMFDGIKEGCETLDDEFNTLEDDILEE